MKKGCKPKETQNKRSIPLPVLGNKEKDKGIADSKTSRWRAAALITLNLLMIAHIIQWRITGSTVSPIEPSEAMFTIQNGAVNAGFIFFALAILATLIFGRFVCGWGCHIVALQDFCAWLLKKIGMKPRPFRSRVLVYVPVLVAFYMFVWPTILKFFVKAENEPLFPGFTNHIITTDFWATFPPVAVAIPFLFICGFVTVYFLGSKGFCTYGCPYGGVFVFADKVAPGRIRVTEDCNECGHCTATCTSNVLVHAEVKEHGMVVDPGCMKCMDCVSVCPNDALYFGFGKPSVGTENKVARRYSLTWPEEIAAALVFFVSFMAAWDAYQMVAMLMALGIAIVTTFLAVKSWQLILSKQSSFYKFSLKTGGKVTVYGIAFLAFSGAWIGLNAHTGWINYNESRGRAAFESVAIPDELALAQVNPGQWLKGNEVETVKSGVEHFRTAASQGLFVNKVALPKLAWLEFLSGDPESATKTLSRSAEYQDGAEKALNLYYRGAILNRQGKHREALESLEKALNVRPDLIVAREERGVALWHLGKKNEAVDSWKAAVERNPRLVISANMISGAAELRGDNGEAVNFEKQADANTPNDPYFHWMLGLRLKDTGMKNLSEKHFELAARLNPAFRARQR
ncbi:MAG: 4Fe-4S binding protein [Pyrinomonadaceae bacterium]|nr:4Fe-4S binding protein [Pyrinomonadaceae bacterium]